MRKSTTSERLKYILKERGLKQTDILKLAEPYTKQYNVQLKKNDLSQYVNGKSKPGQFKLTILAKALNVNEAWLMGYDVPIEYDVPLQEDDVSFLNGLTIKYPKQKLSPELEALNVLLEDSGRQIIKINNVYLLDEIGTVSEEGVNKVLNDVISSAKQATDKLIIDTLENISKKI